MDNVNERLAQHLRAVGLNEYAYETAKECPQGHTSTDVTTGDFSEPVWGSDDEWGAGTLCLTCLTNDRALVPLSADADVDYFRARKVRDEHNTDPTWHPDYRVQEAAKDFGKPEVLFPALWAYFDFFRQRDAQASRGIDLSISLGRGIEAHAFYHRAPMTPNVPVTERRNPSFVDIAETWLVSLDWLVRKEGQ